MTPLVYQIEIGELPKDEAARLEWQHYIDESQHQTGETGLIQGLLVLSGPQVTTKKVERQFGLIVKETNQTKAVIWVGSIIGTVIHLANSHSELDSLPEQDLRTSLNLLREESPEFHQSVLEMLSQPDHTLETRPTAGSGNGARKQTIYSREQLARESFKSQEEREKIVKKIDVPDKKSPPIPNERTIGPDNIGF
jgi:hypothetical protein